MADFDREFLRDIKKALDEAYANPTTRKFVASRKDNVVPQYIIKKELEDIQPDLDAAKSNPKGGDPVSKPTPGPENKFVGKQQLTKRQVHFEDANHFMDEIEDALGDKDELDNLINEGENIGKHLQDNYTKHLQKLADEFGVPIEEVEKLSRKKQIDEDLKRQDTIDKFAGTGKGLTPKQVSNDNMDQMIYDLDNILNDWDENFNEMTEGMPPEHLDEANRLAGRDLRDQREAQRNNMVKDRMGNFNYDLVKEPKFSPLEAQREGGRHLDELANPEMKVPYHDLVRDIEDIDNGTHPDLSDMNRQQLEIQRMDREFVNGAVAKYGKEGYRKNVIQELHTNAAWNANQKLGWKSSAADEYRQVRRKVINGVMKAGQLGAQGMQYVMKIAGPVGALMSTYEYLKGDPVKDDDLGDWNEKQIWDAFNESPYKNQWQSN